MFSNLEKRLGRLNIVSVHLSTKQVPGTPLGTEGCFCPQHMQECKQGVSQSPYPVILRKSLQINLWIFKEGNWTSGESLSLDPTIESLYKLLYKRLSNEL